MATRSTIELKKYVTMLADAGVMRKPRWLAAIEKFPPPGDQASGPGSLGKKPRDIKYPEDELVANYYRSNPAASLEPVDLGSFDPPPARAFAYRQLELMKTEGLSRREALAKAKKEMLSGEGQGERLIEKIQEEEGRHLDDAVARYKATYLGEDSGRAPN